MLSRKLAVTHTCDSGCGFFMLWFLGFSGGVHCSPTLGLW
jgi:hypothetical protein